MGKKILSANEEYAQQNSRFLAENKKLCLNMISSPGSGKTSILTRTITELKGRIAVGVIEGDICTELDSQRIRKTNAPAVQIETKGSCHLSASQVTDALDKLPIGNLDLIFIENVGNLVCPTAFELGENAKVVVLSVPEGDDKPAKYPAIFAKSEVMLINKTDLLAMVDFDIGKVVEQAKKLNPGIEIFQVSAKTGQGFQGWCNWLMDSISRLCS
ncbi:MAG: hydrogenase nickel incorporation protein HypB [Planctomycetes bacterium]|nr:hydrogenase nickel incorporation protein HypB [Planctomycetota bacterium]